MTGMTRLPTCIEFMKKTFSAIPKTQFLHVIQ
jgi:hypothetical protein